MKRFWLCCLSVLLVVCMLPVGASAQTAPVLTLLHLCHTQQGLSVTYRLTGWDDASQLTCRIYEGNEERLVWIDQFNTKGGVQTKVFSLSGCEDGYSVSFGGTGIVTPRTVFLPDGSEYTSPGTVYTQGVTAGAWAEEFAGLTDVQVTRGGETLNPTDPVMQGDVVQGVLPCGTKVSFYGVVYGDVNGDGKINAVDALMILQHAVGKITLSAPAVAAADPTGSGKVNAGNALAVLQFAVGKISAL